MAWSLLSSLPESMLASELINVLYLLSVDEQRAFGEFDINKTATNSFDGPV